ncbi:MAG: Rap1a/Tai family immunity protein [Pseudomonadota bacterium]
MRFFIAICLAVSVVSLAPASQAEAQQLPPPPTYQAQQFQFDCQQPSGPGRDRCMNYLGGIIDMQRHAVTMGQTPPLFCPPMFTSADQARMAYLEWGQANPFMIVGPPIISIVQAFEQMYQCQR